MSASFDKQVERALDELPSFARRALGEHGIEVVIRDEPPASVREEFGNEVFGLFTGQPLSEQASQGIVTEPTRIELYESVFKRLIGDEEERREQVRRTVVHEVGHFLGMDEEDLRERGF
jgi:predicted Zn-dependent protease with MMP-like domain